MALGTLGSTLNDELNRLANGGTYRDMDDMVDEALAAKQWANRENIIPYSTDTVGILNEIAGLGLDKKNWLDFNGVCNYIAGTTGLPAAAALRQVYPTTDLLTSQASYYVDALYPTGLTSIPGYVYLNGVAGNNITSPDSSALDITGDIDIRVRVALDDWTPAANLALISKWNTNGNQRSYDLRVQTTGVLQFLWSTDGSVASQALSTVATGLTDGTVKWIRVTFDVNNGAGGNDAKFYTSDDAVTWTQLGTTVTAVGATSIFNSTAQLEIGSDSLTLNPAAGKFYRAQVLNGIDGTVVFDANMANVSQTATSFTESSSNAATVTINGFRAYPQSVDNLGAAGSLLPTTLGSSTAADSNDPKFLDFTGTNYVYLPGVAGNRLSIPDAANLDTTDLDFRIRISLDSPTTTGNYASRLVSDPNRAWLFGYTGGTTAARMSLAWYPTGSAASAISVGGTVGYENSYTAGQSHWARVTLDVDNGAGGYVVKFFTAPDSTTVPTSWTQVGTTITGGTTTSLPNITSGIDISQSTAFLGKVFRAQLMDGIDGTAIVDIDTSIITSGAATSFFALSGQTVTINRSTSGRKTVAVTQPTWLFGTDDYMEVNNRWLERTTANYLYLPGIASNNATAPDSAALDITGDIDLRAKVALDDWTPAADTTIISKTAAGNDSYNLIVNAAGTLRISWVNSSAVAVNANSTVATGITDGSVKWVRATLDVDNGASGNDAKFFLSDDGITWTQLGTTVTTAGTTDIRVGTAPLYVGAYRDSSSMGRGKFFRAQVLNGIGGTVAFDANFETSITSLNQASFTESSTNAATVTINRSGSTYRSAGITAAGYLYPGATNTFSASATDFLNFGAADSFTLVAAIRQWATTGDRRIISKSITGSAATYNLSSLTSNRGYFQVSEGTNFPTATANVTEGSLATIAGWRNVPADTVNISVNSGTTVSATDTTTGSINPPASTLRIGAQAGGVFFEGEVMAVAAFRTILTSSQIRQIVNYFANREVYL
jgi:hypothetical protein